LNGFSLIKTVDFFFNDGTMSLLVIVIYAGEDQNLTADNTDNADFQ